MAHRSLHSKQCAKFVWTKDTISLWVVSKSFSHKNMCYIKIFTIFFYAWYIKDANKLTGSIPTATYALRELKHLNLGGCCIIWRVTYTWFQTNYTTHLTNSRFSHLSLVPETADNLLKTEISSKLGDLQNLKVLDLRKLWIQIAKPYSILSVRTSSQIFTFVLEFNRQ